jgi:phosphoribosylformimino-5-aminoimidazole carboxamide ribotide isomerase
MIVYPAIDLRGGRVVRLQEGDPDKQTVFRHDPIQVASEWIDQGAEWLHIVNLDGAFEQQNDNLAVVREICKLPVKVQFGGGIRSVESVGEALKTGASRVVVGTLAARNPEVVTELIGSYGADAICVAMDARDGFVTTHGWTEKTTITPIEFGTMMRSRGVNHSLFTDVNRDGSMQGANAEHTINLARATGLQVIASGGVSTPAEIRALAASGSVAGVVIGMALYRKEMTLQDALDAARRVD